MKIEKWFEMIWDIQKQRQKNATNVNTFQTEVRLIKSTQISNKMQKMWNIDYILGKTGNCGFLMHYHCKNSIQLFCLCSHFTFDQIRTNYKLSGDKSRPLGGPNPSTEKVLSSYRATFGEQRRFRFITTLLNINQTQRADVFQSDMQFSVAGFNFICVICLGFN